MQKIVTLAAVTILLLACSDTQAANRRVRTTGTYVSSNQGNGPFARLMELERRKNAALRQMFFSR